MLVNACDLTVCWHANVCVGIERERERERERESNDICSYHLHVL